MRPRFLRIYCCFQNLNEYRLSRKNANSFYFCNKWQNYADFCKFKVEHSPAGPKCKIYLIPSCLDSSAAEFCRTKSHSESFQNISFTLQCTVCLSKSPVSLIPFILLNTAIIYTKFPKISIRKTGVF